MCNIQYTVINTKTGKEEGADCIVTQDGKIAFWDDSRGWSEDEDQDKYDIQLFINKGLPIE